MTTIRRRIVPDGFGQRLREMRTNAGLTQAALAEPQYTKAYISMLESGRTRASMRALMHISNRLNVSLPELMGGRTSDGTYNMTAIPTDALFEELKRRTAPL